MVNQEVKVYGAQESPFSKRVEIALKLKGVEYDYAEEDLLMKSPELLKYNPIHGKVPVLLHNGRPIAESLVILEYIDETWESGASILPKDPHERATSRFLTKLIDDKLLGAVWKFVMSKGKDEDAISEIGDVLDILENELKDKKFFGRDRIGLVDIVANIVALWLDVIQQVIGTEIFKKGMYPKLSKWIDEYMNCSIIKDTLPSRDHLLAFWLSRFQSAPASE
ncbi:putative glutathione S-transferase [Apium graveolens]|uniref:putative glutathione S-transferase n=1 Tax=Apium graveolens TaxID=4045 RepID=UPI003D795149